MRSEGRSHDRHYERGHDRSHDRDRSHGRDEERGYGPASRGRGGRRPKRFVELRYHEIDYRNERLLRKFITERGKIVPRRTSGIPASFQRRLTREIKRARHLAMLPFVGESFR
jgi:small subunit ribosomal protein S18